MTNGFEFHPLIGELWGELETLYRNREEAANIIATKVGLSGSGLSRAISEGRDAHLSTFIRVAGALGYEIQISLVPEDQIDDDFQRVVTEPRSLE